MMRKIAASVITVLAAVAMSGVMMSVAWAEPSSVLGKALGGWAKRQGVTMLEIRRHRGDRSLDTIILKDGKTIMMQKSIPPKVWTKRSKSKNIPMKTVRKYDMEKLKTLRGGAGYAHGKVMHSPDVKGRPTLRCITLRENEEGNLQFIVHAHHPATHRYHGFFVVDVASGYTVSELQKPADRNYDPMQEKWGDPIEAKEAAEGEEGEAGKEGTEGEGEKAGGFETQ